MISCDTGCIASPLLRHAQLSLHIHASSLPPTLLHRMHCTCGWQQPQPFGSLHPSLLMQVLFLQGGASQAFSSVPLNLAAEGDTVDHIITGSWSKKATEEARKYCNVNVAAKGDNKNVPARDGWKLSQGAKYLHYCDNETIQASCGQLNQHPSGRLACRAQQSTVSAHHSNAAGRAGGDCADTCLARGSWGCSGVPCPPPPPPSADAVSGVALTPVRHPGSWGSSELSWHPLCRLPSCAGTF